MTHRATAEHLETSDLIAGRYQVEEKLGQGGMATVHLVLDTTTKRRMALKRMLAEDNPEKQEQASKLFEREFYTLAQLAHPRVVEAYDFGRDETGPYYTMELLDGGDLRDLSPLPWKQACSLLADVCSVLSLLHSRRLIHRDLSPRNVRCTKDLKAKLIDFGAMVPMGPCKDAIGTPAFVSPEVLAKQALDARADLFSLGTTLYYALTGRSSFPARNFSELRNLWRSKPRPPSTVVDGIPKELDNLVLSLIDLDPIARPTSAAEVIERLSAIAGLEIDEHLLVSKAYLSTPVLVGRAQHVARVRRRVLGVLRRRGATLLIEGPSGVGRTRFLDACVLEAKLAGATVLRVDPSDAHAGNWSAARVLATRLLDELPQLALKAAEPHLPVLGHILPELIGKGVPSQSVSPAAPAADGQRLHLTVQGTNSVEPQGPESLAPLSGPLVEAARRCHSWQPPPRTRQPNAVLEVFDDSHALRPRLQAAMRDWVLKVADEQALMIAVDDIHRLDEPSAALMARLSEQTAKKMLLLAVTTQTDAPATAPGAIELLRDGGAPIALNNLALEDTEQLLSSVFGEAPNVRLLADRLQTISHGAPGPIMELAQHLVDKGVVRYEAGAWTLPDRIDAGDLPASLTETLKAKAKRLGPEALRLAQALALSPEHSFGLEECAILGDSGDKAVLLQSLSELATSGIVSTDGQHYALAQQGWVSPLVEDLDKESERTLQANMAEVFSLRGSEDFRVAMHLFAAGQDEQGLDVLVHDAESSGQNLVQNTADFYKHIQSLPANWLDTYKVALRLCQELNRPPKQAFLLRTSLIRFSILSGLEDISILHDVIDQIARDSGLKHYEELGDSVDSEARLWRALELAQQDYDATPEFERVLSPAEAIRELASAISHIMGTASNAYDYTLVAAMPSVEPFEPLSPAVGVVGRILKTGRYLMSGRYEQARESTRELMDRIAQPDRGGLDDTIHRITHYSWAFSMGVTEASFGLKSCLRWADEIEQDLLHQVNAWRVRMIYYVRQGDIDKAEQCKKRVEMLRIQHSPTQHFEGVILFPEVLAYGMADDLVRVKRVIEDIEQRAKRFRTWVPILHFARGEYQRIRGDYQSALSEFDQALSLIAPGRHVVWPYVAGAHVRTLFELGRLSEGKRVAEQRLLAAEDADMSDPADYIRMPLALIQAKVGEAEDAIELAETPIEHFCRRGTTGLTLGTAYEVRARVAMFMNDHEGFCTYARLCAEQYQTGHNPALTAKYEKLMQEARRSKLGVSEDLAHAAEFSEFGTEGTSSFVETVLTECHGPQERMRRALEVLVTQAKCSGGFLYTMRTTGPLLCAQIGDLASPAEMDDVVKAYIKEQADDAADVTMTVADLGESASSQLDWTNHKGEEFYPVLLGHDDNDGYYITGVAVLLPQGGAGFILPAEAAAAVSRALLEAGDVSAVLSDG